MPTTNPKSTQSKPTQSKPTNAKPTPTKPHRHRAIPESVVQRSLSLSSRKAARLWAQLDSGMADPMDLLPALQQAQGQQEDAVDIHVTLRQHIDAEIAAAQARLDALVAVHEADLKRLKGWANRLDQGVLDLYEQGLISEEALGQTYRIRVKRNPPSCVVLDESMIPEQYIKVKTTYAPDKTAIKGAIQGGETVPGADLVRKLKVLYEAAPTSLNRMADQAQV
ncbi:siphovirus Gp157 family protein [Phormidium sp. FACHB-1136]|uniref:siphovirus Gp157 family protein n=1 Tax=Phormidium sp. FACHB-1136 TaxID=2692848 RepID=UPI00168A24C5|nr:siphovirus Gp157 family protein [Phormidium sp. FACHB-1136]MBD2429507.1 siphovirus Gp157 family protein [Phormidium sp. FACHB-1136]